VRSREALGADHPALRAGFAAWVLARRPLFALDRIVAATLALTFSAVTTAGAATLAMTRDGVGTWRPPAGSAWR
jgi:hypothetical protein